MTDLQKPVLIVVAGPNGAGKTSLTEKIESINKKMILLYAFSKP